VPTRFVRLVGGAALLAALAACGGDTTSPDTPIPAAITVQPSSTTLDAIGATVSLTATVQDQHGRLMTNAPLTWRSANTAIASVSAVGVVTAVANGTTDIIATAGTVESRASITVAQAPHAFAAVSGDHQTGSPGTVLAQPLVVRVSDRLGHGVAGVAVSFRIASGGGSIDPGSAITSTTGEVQAIWTLGADTGTQQVRAAASGFDTVTFTATAETAPHIAAITPDTLVEGQPVTITGSNFNASAAGNTVTIDGVAATVTAASTTSLTATVPSFPCRPVRLVTVSIQVGGQTATSAPVPLRPAMLTSLAIGEEVVIQDPSKFCLQLPATSSGSEMYVMGLSAPAETPGAVLPFLITARGGVAPSASLVAGPAPASTAAALARRAPAVPRARVTVPNQAGEVWRERVRAESRLRRWEAKRLSAILARRGRSPLALPRRALAASATPAVGDTLTIRVPDLGATNLCTTYTTIRAVVRVIGSAGIWVQDVTNPTTDSLTLADIQAASNLFDTAIYAADTTYFGHPSDIDANGRVIIVLTWQVNKSRNILGFVFGGDLFPGNPDCPQSNGGELYYGEVPDPLNTAGTGAREKKDVVQRMPQLIAHEFSHIVQMSQRVILHNGFPMAGWEMEGQATFAEELVGHAVLGNTSYQNYGRSVAFGSAGFPWYADVILKWAEYFGVFGSNPQEAPDLCTVYGNTNLTALPCDVSAFYGASWILQRYIGDQYGPGYPGGLVQLTRDWVSKNVTLSGTANIAALLGVSYDSLFVRFATALALDDQPNGTGTAWVPAPFRITSWDSNDLSGWLAECCGLGWLAPPVMGFGDATANRSVRGGSTAYVVLTASGAHPAAAFRITDPSGNALGTGLRPALWLVRVQ
jgi:hypothetical protein